MGEQKAKYNVVNKCFDGIKIVGLTIQNDEGKTKFVENSDIIKLARGNKIQDTECILDTDTGKYTIDYKKGLSSLDDTYKSSGTFTPLCRIISKGKCMGYKVRDNNGKSYKFSISKIWELAYNHSVVGVKAAIIGETKVLLSTDGMDLKNLPKTIA